MINRQLARSKKHNVFLFISTCALVCLSLSVAWHFTIGLSIVWFALFAVTICQAPKENTSEKPIAQSIHSYVAAFFVVILFFNFFYTLTTRKPLEIMEGMGFTKSVVTIVFFLLASVGSFVGYYALRVYVQYFIPLFTPLGSVLRKMYKQYIVLAVIYLCALLSILRANFYYIDDLNRNIHGAAMTGDFSRYIASYLATLLHGNEYLTDISPLPQILAALIMALAAIVTLNAVSDRTEFHIKDIICLIPFGLSPYFLECYSYKYDAPYMALSVLAAVYPLLFRSHNTKKYVISIVVGTIVVCTTYQVSAAVFPMCVAFLCFVSWNRGESLKDTLSFLLKSASGYVTGMLFFRLFMMEPVARGEYVSTSISLRVFPANITDYFTRILEDFNLVWLVLIFLIILGFIIAVCSSSRQKKVPAALLAAFSLVIMFILSNGLYSFFTDPLTSARSMYGFGIFLSLLSFYILDNSNILLSHIAICLLAWLMFIFGFTYGNALSSQKDYTDFRTEQVWADLSDLDLMKASSQKVFAVSGTIGYAESVGNMLHLYPVLSDLVPVLLSDTEWYWGAYQLQYYYGIDNFTRDTAQTVKTQTNLVMLVDSVYHTIYGNENYILIELK